MKKRLGPLKAYTALKPLDIDGRRMLADLYRDLKDRPAALAELEAIYALQAENGGDIDTMVKTVKLEWEMGDKKASISDLEAQIEKHPSEAQLLVTAGRYYSETKQSIRAIFTWERILNVAGNDERYTQMRIEALTRLAAEYEK